MPLTRITTQFISYPASGSVANTSSWANNVNYTDVRNINSSSSFAGTASYAITSSYSTKSETLLSGANINAGQITASAISVTTLNVVTITSSIDYASGSNIFGTKSTDTQQFTGSVSITGSLTVNGSITGTSSYSTIAGTASYSALAQTASYIANAVSASYALTASYASNVPATSSWSIQAQTASYVANAISSSYALTASYAANVPASSSWSVQAQTASYVLNAISASYSGTASYALNGGGTSLVTGSTYNITSSWAVNSSTASYALNGGGTSLITGSTYNITSSWALNAVTSSFALYALNAGSSGTASLLTAQTFAVSGSSETIFTLIQPVADVDQVLVTVSGILQSRSGSYTVSASTLTFSAVVPSGSLVDVRFLNASGLAGPSLTSSYAATASYVVSAFTASYVTTAQTASYVIMAQTASYVLLAKSASYVLNAVSASYSTTASYALNALSASYAPNTYVLPSNVVSASAQLSNGGGTAFTNSNNITVGQVTASAISVTTLSVVTITSSIDYASGSNIFGTKSTDTQLFTGSVRMSGSLNVTGTLNATGLTTLGGNGIGVTPTASLNISDLNDSTVRVWRATTEYIQLAAARAGITGQNNTFLLDIVGNPNLRPFKIRQSANGGSSFTDAIVLDTTGNVGFGTSSPTYKLDVSDTAGSLARFKSTTASDQFFINNAASNPDYSANVVIQSDNAGSAGHDLFRAQVTNSSGTRFVVKSGGNVGIGTTSPSVKLDVVQTSNDVYIRSKSTTAGAWFVADSAADGYFGYILSANGTEKWRIGQTGGADSLDIMRSGTTVARIESSGKVLIQGGKLNLNNAAGGYAMRQCLTGTITAGSSTVSKKIVYVGPTHALDVTILAIQGGSPANTAAWSGKITTAYGASYTGGNVSAVGGNITAISVTYDNGGSPSYTINVALTYTGAAPDIAYTIDGHSVYDLSAQ